MANTVGINLVANNTQALRAIRQTRDSLGSLNQGFQRLQNVIGGIALGALVRNVLQTSAAMSNLAQATGVNTAAISAFSEAMVSAGGTSDRAIDAISDLTKNTGEAAAGSRELIDAFASLGIGLTDLANADQAEILQRTIAGLSAIPNQAERSALAMRLLGESVKGVDIGALNAQFSAGSTSAQANAAAIESAAAANRALNENLTNLTTAITNVLKPFNDLVSGLRISADAFESVIKIVAALGASFLVFTRVLPMLQGATNAMYALQTATRPAVNQFVKLNGNFQRMIGHLGRVITNTGAAASRMASLSLAASQFLKFAARFAGIAGVIYAVGTAVLDLARAFAPETYRAATEALARGWDYVKERLLGYKEELAQPMPEDQSAAETQRLASQARQLQQAQAIREVISDQSNKNREVLQGIQAQNTELLRQYNLATSLIGLSEANADRAQQMATLEQQRVNAVAPLEREIAKLTASRNELDRARVPLIEANIAAINREFATTRAALENSINLREREQAIQQQQIDLMAEFTRQEQQREQVEASIRDILLDGITQERQAVDQARLDNLFGIQRTLAEIEIQERRVAEAARARVAEQVGEDSAALASAIERIDRASEAVIQRRQEQARSIAEEQNQFSTGWSQALNQYLEQTYNAADQARNLFSTATRGMEEAILGFVRTGKISFKSLIQDMVAALLRSQLQRLIGSVFGAGGGGAGGSFLGSLFAGFFADGGRIPSNKVGLVGERGPELVSGPATVTPMGQLAGAGSSNVTYNINAVDAASFRQLVARDPEFIFAVTEQGRKSIPNRRR
jgi:lambda family phage tail tape measure protein